MCHLVDFKRVQQTMGELMGKLWVFDCVTAALLRQLTVWGADFALHSHDFAPRLLTALVHKMKGSCQAVAALGVAQVFAQAEQVLPRLQAHEWPACQRRLVSWLNMLEAEISAITGRVDAC